MGNIYPIFLNEKYPKNIWTIYPKNYGNKIQNLRFGARCRRQGFNPMGDPSEEYTLKADGFSWRKMLAYVEVEKAETTGFSTHCLRGNLESFGIFWLKQKP